MLYMMLQGYIKGYILPGMAHHRRLPGGGDGLDFGQNGV